mmetsp:Transcript_70580/g.155653  ORF Transcript_70580/g.155653 Transcript_70580/m.155653 type:complete len:217 (+) Transcript_70580:224-874(+)
MTQGTFAVHNGMLVASTFGIAGIQVQWVVVPREPVDAGDACLHGFLHPPRGCSRSHGFRDIHRDRQGSAEGVHIMGTHQVGDVDHTVVGLAGLIFHVVELFHQSTFALWLKRSNTTFQGETSSGAGQLCKAFDGDACVQPDLDPGHLRHWKGVQNGRRERQHIKRGALVIEGHGKRGESSEVGILLVDIAQITRSDAQGINDEVAHIVFHRLTALS